MAIPWRHQPSPWPAAAGAAGRWNRLSTHALCLAVNQNRKYNVFLGSFEYLLFFRWIVIYIRLVWFQRRVTILFTVFKLAQAPLTRTLRATAATKYSMQIPSCPLTIKEVYEVKQANNVNNISRTCNTEQQEAQQNTLWRCILGACYQWLSLIMDDFPLL